MEYHKLGADFTCLCRGLECTGTLIGPKHVVTAAHCVFDINDSRQYVSSLNFAPGEMSQNSLPFGTAQWSSVRVLSQFTSQVWHSATLHPAIPRVCLQMLSTLCIALPASPHDICTVHFLVYVSWGGAPGMLLSVMAQGSCFLALSRAIRQQHWGVSCTYLLV